MAYLDTSILAAYYCPEPLSAAVDKTLKHLKTPAISPLVEVEFASALSRKVRMGQLDVVSAGKILSQFQVHRSAGCYELLALRTREFTLARSWLERFSTPLRTLDALHLATAFSHGHAIFTSDKAMADSASLLGVPFQWIS